MIFCVGRSQDAGVAQRVRLEATRFGDLLQTSAPDDYKLLTVKAHSWLRLLAPQRARFRFLVKMDDDVSVDLAGLARLLAAWPGPRPRALLCSPVKHVADRRRHSKWWAGRGGRTLPAAGTCPWSSSPSPTWACSAWAWPTC